MEPVNALSNTSSSSSKAAGGALGKPWLLPPGASGRGGAGNVSTVVHPSLSIHPSSLFYLIHRSFDPPLEAAQASPSTTKNAPPPPQPPSLLT